MAAAAVAVTLGYALQSHAHVAVGVAVGATGLWALSRPAVAAVALGASLPAFSDLAGAHAGVHVAASDLVLTLFTLVLLIEVAAQRTAGLVRSLRPISYALIPYCALLVVLVGAHPGAKSFLNTAQRFEIFLLPLLVGVFLALRQQHVRVLQAYVLACAVVAVVWPLDHMGMQKNPTGQFLANAILLTLGVRELRRFVLITPLLAFGLLTTQSRGAVFALVLGIGVVLVFKRGIDVRGVIFRLAPLALAGVLVVHWMPSENRNRLTTISADAGTTSGYSIYIRDQYRRDAEQVISAHPWTGIGVGSYASGAAAGETRTTDPHNVILLEAAEGGYGLAAAFVLLVISAVIALWRLRRVPLAAAAAAVLVATAAHGLVDVYWVRGTPVLGWLLVGAVGGLALRSNASSQAT
jgi:hypothetical protein